jgi:hypothetical protein
MLGAFKVTPGRSREIKIFFPHGDTKFPTLAGLGVALAWVGGRTAKRLHPAMLSYSGNVGKWQAMTPTPFSR